MKLKDKVAIITGAGRPAPLQDGSAGSIGYGIATAYAKEGASDAYRPAAKPTAAKIAKSTALAFTSPAAILCIVLYLIVCILR